MDSKVILWKSNNLTEKKTYQNTYNSFPKNFLQNDSKNIKPEISTEIESLSEELSPFMEKMVNLMQIVTKSIKCLDSKLDKIEEEIANYHNSEAQSNNREQMLNRFTEIKDQYSEELKRMEDLVSAGQSIDYN